MAKLRGKITKTFHKSSPRLLTSVIWFDSFLHKVFKGLQFWKSVTQLLFSRTFGPNNRFTCLSPVAAHTGENSTSSFTIIVIFYQVLLRFGSALLSFWFCCMLISKILAQMTFASFVYVGLIMSGQGMVYVCDMMVEHLDRENCGNYLNQIMGSAQR